MSVSYSAYQPSGQLGSKLEHVIITFQKNEIPLFGRAVEVVGWQSIFIGGFTESSVSNGSMA